MNFIRKLFLKDTNYPPQVLDSKQLGLIEYLDSLLVNLHADQPYVENTYFVVKEIHVGMTRQHLPLSVLCNFIKNSIVPSNYYMPRSIAFVCNYEGHWSLYYSVRSANPQDEAVGELTSLFINAMLRTNDARISFN